MIKNGVLDTGSGFQTIFPAKGFRRRIDHGKDQRLSNRSKTRKISVFVSAKPDARLSPHCGKIKSVLG